MVGGIAILNHVLEIVVVSRNIGSQILCHHRATGGITGAQGLLHIVPLGEVGNGECYLTITCRCWCWCWCWYWCRCWCRCARSCTHHRCRCPRSCPHHRCWCTRSCPHHWCWCPWSCTHHRCRCARSCPHHWCWRARSHSVRSHGTRRCIPVTGQNFDVECPDKPDVAVFRTESSIEGHLQKIIARIDMRQQAENIATADPNFVVIR